MDRRARRWLAHLWSLGILPGDVLAFTGRLQHEMLGLARHWILRQGLSDTDRRSAAWRHEIDALAGASARGRNACTNVVAGQHGHLRVEFWSATFRWLQLLLMLPECRKLPNDTMVSLASVDDDPSAAGLDPRLLDWVRALLAKAESTDYAPEADAFTAKAQELTARHAIDEVMLHSVAGQTGHPPHAGKPIVRRICIDDPYARAKFSLRACSGGISDGDGWAVGVAAADRADLGGAAACPTAVAALAGGR
jgi:plasmid stabilization system protein ParE